MVEGVIGGWLRDALKGGVIEGCLRGCMTLHKATFPFCLFLSSGDSVLCGDFGPLRGFRSPAATPKIGVQFSSSSSLYFLRSCSEFISSSECRLMIEQMNCAGI